MQIATYFTYDLFTLQTIPIGKTCNVYMLTDGYTDQLNPTSTKKFSTKQFKINLLNIQKLSMKRQKLFLEKELTAWIDDGKQTDDILEVGFNVWSGVGKKK